MSEYISLATCALRVALSKQISNNVFQFIQATDLNVVTVGKVIEVVDGALVISQHIATPCVLEFHVSSELKVPIMSTHVTRTVTRLGNYNQHLRVAVGKTALPYALWQFWTNAIELALFSSRQTTITTKYVLLRILNRPR